MAHPHPIRHTIHTLRGLIGSSTQCPSDTARMACPHLIWRTPHTFRGPIGNSTEGYQWQSPHG
eukprot:16588-Pyramimonas_sp.AAC.1